MNDDPFDDTPERCDPPCHHGWVEVYQDADGKYLGHDRWGPTTGRVPVESVVYDEAGQPVFAEDGSPMVRHDVIDLVKFESTYPCPIHEPDLFLRWQDGKLGSDRPQKRGSRT